MPVAELEREQQTNIQYEPMRVVEEPLSTRRIGRALGQALALHRSKVFDRVDESTKRDMIGELNWPISRGNTLVEQALYRFHSHLFAQTGTRKDPDINTINSIVKLVNGEI